MSAVEDRVARLESAVGSQGLELLRTRIELQLYKALIASRRWGSPGGNDKAIEALDLALFDLDRAALPAGLDDLRASLKADIIEYREGLRRLKVTATATNQTRLYRTCDRFAAEVTGLAEGARA
jgi:hypothetical protein